MDPVKVRRLCEIDPHERAAHHERETERFGAHVGTLDGWRAEQNRQKLHEHHDAWMRWESVADDLVALQRRVRHLECAAIADREQCSRSSGAAYRAAATSGSGAGVLGIAATTPLGAGWMVAAAVPAAALAGWLAWHGLQSGRAAAAAGGQNDRELGVQLAKLAALADYAEHGEQATAPIADVSEHQDVFSRAGQ